jgi:hypothetical protein
MHLPEEEIEILRSPTASLGPSAGNEASANGRDLLLHIYFELNTQNGGCDLPRSCT